jgi:hypothetical protein
MNRWVVKDVLRGSDFITNLRISWIREINPMPKPPLVVQFLGTEDGLVSEEDSQDIQAFPTGYQEHIPGGAHSDLFMLSKAQDPEARFQLIASAFQRPREIIQVREVGTKGRRVVLLLHGIRANNRTWVRDLQEFLAARWPDTVAIAATYGRFSARKFVFPMTRRKFLGWLQDMYAERLAENPQATFYFIGHSNGTYLLGHSLNRIPGMRFDRVLLAGSVLPASYDWKNKMAARQVAELRNDCAERDVPVAVLCAALRGLGMNDVGTAGFDGFTTWQSSAKREIAYYRGGHGAALAADNLPRLAAYLMDGDPGDPPDLIREPPRGFSLLSRAAPWLARLVVISTISGAAWFVLEGPWSIAVNLLVLLIAAGIALVLVDLV